MQTALPGAPTSSSSRQLNALFASGRPLLYLVSAEEQRIGRLLREAARCVFPKPVPLWSWTLTEGMRCGDGAPLGKDTTDPRAALDFIAGFKGPAELGIERLVGMTRRSSRTAR
jgi:hypothetical protein